MMTGSQIQDAIRELEDDKSQFSVVNNNIRCAGICYICPFDSKACSVQIRWLLKYLKDNHRHPEWFI